MDEKEKMNGQNPETEQKKTRKELSVNQIKAAVAAVLVASFALSTFVHSDFLEEKRMAAEIRRQEEAARKQAEEEAKEALRLEEARQAERAEKLVLYKEKLTEALAKGDLAASRKYISYLEDDYEEHAWVREQTAAYRPSVPLPSQKEGTYEANFVLSFSLDLSLPGNAAYGGEIHYEVSPAVEEKEGQLSFTENNTYSITAYTTNQLGLESEKVTYTYVLDKLIPNAVQADVEPGYFNAPVTVSLAQDQNFPIYYTVDGSAVTTESALYTGPIELQTGFLDLRASGYSAAGDMLGEEVSFYYHITPASSGLESNDMLLTSRGTFLRSGRTLQLVVNGESVHAYEAVGNIDAFCEDQNRILYSTGTQLYHLDLSTGESAELGQAPGSIRQLLRSGTRIFALTSSGELMHRQENEWIGFLTGVESVCMSPDGSALYYVSESDICKLDADTLEHAAVISDSDGIYAVACGSGALFYTSDKGDFKRGDPETGETALILEYTQDSEHRNPYVSGLLDVHDGYTLKKEQFYRQVMTANGRVYVRSQFRTERTIIDYWNRSNRSTSTNSEYSWLVFNGNTMEQEGTIDVDSAPIIGDGYYAKAIGQGTFTQPAYAGAEPETQEPSAQESPAQEPAAKDTVDSAV